MPIFDEVTPTQALGDLKLSNKAGKRATTRFKLDSGAEANFLPILVYYSLFSKADRDSESSIIPSIQLIAANKSRIKQLGSVNLRVSVGSMEKVCKFFIVPNYVRPIFGLPDLTRMDLVKFSMPISSEWDSGDSHTTLVDSQDTQNHGISKDQVLDKYHKVFSGLGRLKFEPVKIYLKENAQPTTRKPCRRVPIAIRQQFMEELDNSCKEGILMKLKANRVTEWLNSFVNVGKDDGKLRVSLDPTGLNPHIIRPVF